MYDRKLKLSIGIDNFREMRTEGFTHSRRFGKTFNMNAVFDDACKEVLRQIYDRNYEETLIDDGMKIIYKYQIARYKKRYKVISR